MATIRKRGSSWQVQVRREGSHPSSKTFSLRADAVRWGREIERDIELGECPAGSKALSKIRLSDLLSRYSQSVTRNKKGADREVYKIRIMMNDPISNFRLKDLTSKAVAEYRDRRFLLVKQSTVRRELAILQHCLEIAAKEWGIPLKVNPVQKIKLPDAGKPRDVRLKTGDLEKIETATRSSSLWYIFPLIVLAVETGMRRGELLSLKWSNIDLDQRIAKIEHTKNGWSRTIPLSPTAATILVKLPKKHELVFPVSGNAVRLTWERMRNKALLSDLRFHDLRHEAISRMSEMGLSIPEIAMISGHRDYRMLARYTHIRPENVAKKLADIHAAKAKATVTDDQNRL